MYFSRNAKIGVKRMNIPYFYLLQHNNHLFILFLLQKVMPSLGELCAKQNHSLERSKVFKLNARELPDWMPTYK